MITKDQRIHFIHEHNSAMGHLLNFKVMLEKKGFTEKELRLLEAGIKKAKESVDYMYQLLKQEENGGETRSE